MENKDVTSLICRKQVKTAVENMTGKEDPEIVSVQVQRAVKGIEGLGSIVLKVKVEYRCEPDGAVHTKSYVVKRLPDTESQLEIVKNAGVFEKESCYFRTVQPYARRLAEGKMVLPTPESHYSISNGIDDAIFLDDLSISGFRTADQKFRILGMDLSHCEVSMWLLGRLHGLAAASERLLPTGVWESLGPAPFKEVFFYEAAEGESPSVISGAIENSMKTIVVLSKEVEGLPKEAAESGELEKLLEGAMRTMCRLISPEGRDVPNVLCHGDFWMNNIMFRYEKGERPFDAKVVDFQVTRYSHPCTDIFHFLYGCTGRSLRERHMDHLLEVYHESMAETMALVGMGPPFISLDDLKKDAHGKYKTYGAVIGALWHPVFMLKEVYCVESADQFDMVMLDDMLKYGNSALVRKKFTEDDVYRKEMEDIVRELVDVALPEGLENLECSPFRA